MGEGEWECKDDGPGLEGSEVGGLKFMIMSYNYSIT